MLSDNTVTGRGIEIADYLELCPPDNNKSREAVDSSRKLINKCFCVFEKQPQNPPKIVFFVAMFMRMQFKCNVEFLLIRVVINKTINSYSSFGFDWISEALKQQALSEVNVINKFPYKIQLRNI